MERIEREEGQLSGPSEEVLLITEDIETRWMNY